MIINMFDWNNLRKTVLFLFLGVILLLSPFFIYAQGVEKCDNDFKNCTSGGTDERECKSKKLECEIEEYNKMISEKKGQQKTLASAITLINNQMYLTTAQIVKAEEQIVALEFEIDELGKKIIILDQDLDETVNILNSRVEETYKRMQMPSVYLLLVANKFSQFFSQLNYIKSAQTHDKEVLYAMEQARLNYDNQKQLKEKKQDEAEKLRGYLESQKKMLDQQKAIKQDLLITTKNDEKKYQQLLAQARAEFEAIQAIIAGKGDEEKAKDVKAGDVIASVITGSSCNSSGTHLHFTVSQKGVALNPFNYLKSVDHENCSGPGECSEGDPFNPSGSWEWPLSPKIRMNQGYGSTWAVRNTWVGQIYNMHNGIDIIGSSNSVKAVADGVLYRGSYGGSGGCRLRYVRVEHKDSDLETYYLHVNY